MSDTSSPGMLSRLGLSATDREKVAEVTSDLIAIHVYRELQLRNDLAKAAGCSIIGNCSNGSCDIIGNCSSSSKDILLGRTGR